MYISYGFSVGLMVLLGLSLNYLAHDSPLWVYGVSIALVVLLFTTFLFRYARVVMLYLLGSVQ